MLVSFKVCGITQVWKPFAVIFEIVNETPLISIDAFSTSCFISILFMAISKIWDLPIFFIFIIFPAVSTWPWHMWPEIFWPYLSGNSKLISSLILIYLNFDLFNVSLDK